MFQYFCSKRFAKVVFITALLSAPACVFAWGGGWGGGSWGGGWGSLEADLTIYSPAPPQIMLHAWNEDLGTAINECSSESSWLDISANVPAVALPDSINEINADIPAEDKGDHLPIVTTIDLLPARTMSGPEWHAYNEANLDLKLVSVLYEVSFGIMVFDENIQTPADLVGKQIGVTPRPSSVRVFTEALLNAWGILDEVDLIDLPPPAVPGAVQDGSIQATGWNIMAQDNTGTFFPLIPPLASFPGAHWLNVDQATIDSINATNTFITGPTTVDEDTTLLSFKQGLAAWDSTDFGVVMSVLHCIEEKSADFPGLPATPEDMFNWPGISAEIMHPASVAYAYWNGIYIDY